MYMMLSSFRDQKIKLSGLFNTWYFVFFGSNSFHQFTICTTFSNDVDFYSIVSLLYISSPCQRQCDLLPSLGVRRPLTFHILIFPSEIFQPSELKLGRKHLWKVLSKEWTFCSNPLPNMATTGNSCFLLANFFKSPPLKPLGQINRNLVGSIYGMSSMKNAHFVPIG